MSSSGNCASPHFIRTIILLNCQTARKQLSLLLQTYPSLKTVMITPCLRIRVPRKQIPPKQIGPQHSRILNTIVDSSAMVSLTAFAPHSPLFRIPHLLVSSSADIECAATGCGADWAETLLWNDYIPSSKILCCLDLVSWPLLFYCCCEERSTSLDEEQPTRVWLSNCTIIVFFWTRSEIRTEGTDIIEAFAVTNTAVVVVADITMKLSLTVILLLRELPYKFLSMCHERRISSHEDSKKPSSTFQ